MVGCAARYFHLRAHDAHTPFGLDVDSVESRTTVDMMVREVFCARNLLALPPATCVTQSDRIYQIKLSREVAEGGALRPTAAGSSRGQPVPQGCSTQLKSPARMSAVVACG